MFGLIWIFGANFAMVYWFVWKAVRGDRPRDQTEGARRGGFVVNLGIYPECVQTRPTSDQSEHQFDDVDIQSDPSDTGLWGLTTCNPLLHVTDRQRSHQIGWAMREKQLKILASARNRV